MAVMQCGIQLIVGIPEMEAWLNLSRANNSSRDWLMEISSNLNSLGIQPLVLLQMSYVCLNSIEM